MLSFFLSRVCSGATDTGGIRGIKADSVSACISSRRMFPVLLCTPKATLRSLVTRVCLFVGTSRLVFLSDYNIVLFKPVES